MIEIVKNLYYDPETGDAYSNRSAKMKKLMALDGKGYRSVWLNGVMCSWHRLVWTYFNGLILPGKEVDHKDNDPLNNRLDNLQLLSHSDNTRFCKVNKANKAGLPGVSFNKKLRKWKATIRVCNKQKHLGYFEDKNDAYKTYYFNKILSHGIDSVRCLPVPVREEEEYDD